MLTSCNTKPQRGVTMVASRFNGWYKAAIKKRAFRYATSNPCRVPTARYPLTSSLPAIEMAGYHCLMPTASLAKLNSSYFLSFNVLSSMRTILTVSSECSRRSSSSPSTLSPTVKLCVFFGGKGWKFGEKWYFCGQKMNNDGSNRFLEYVYSGGDIARCERQPAPCAYVPQRQKTISINIRK